MLISCLPFIEHWSDTNYESTYKFFWDLKNEEIISFVWIVIATSLNTNKRFSLR